MATSIRRRGGRGAVARPDGGIAFEAMEGEVLGFTRSADDWAVASKLGTARSVSLTYIRTRHGVCLASGTGCLTLILFSMRRPINARQGAAEWRQV